MNVGDWISILNKEDILNPIFKEEDGRFSLQELKEGVWRIYKIYVNEVNDNNSELHCSSVDNKLIKLFKNEVELYQSVEIKEEDIL